MTDRELLEAAARAAGMMGALNWTPGATPWLRVDPDNTRPWNPLTDDGDALRLAVKLRIQIEWTRELAGERRECYQVHPKSLGHLAEFGLVEGDENAMIRRAIVRAAAAMESQK